MNPDDIEPIETATPAGMSDAAGLAGTSSPDPIPIFPFPTAALTCNVAALPHGQSNPRCT
jgi:hypothetical protein